MSGTRAILPPPPPPPPSRRTPYASRLLREFLHKMPEFRKDKLFHREPDGVFGTGG